MRRRAVLAAVVLAGLLAGCGGGQAEAVALVPASKAGADPFTGSVQAGPAVSLPGNVEAISATVREDLRTDSKTTGLVAKGSTPGLYGGSGEAKVCDPDQLVAFLGDDAPKARAWAGVLGIEPSQIGAFVAELTPVVLASDTLVVNHGFRNGRATAAPSVLQSGTAVLVDDTGTPRVKCNCGNPLGRAPAVDLENADIEGTPWELYSPGQVVSVVPADTGGTLTVTDTKTGEPLKVPVGSGSPATGPISTTTTPKPATTTPPPSGPNESLRAVDWQNFTYRQDCDGESEMVMVDGQWQDPYSGNIAGGVEGTVYGDVAATPGEEAMVSVTCVPGGTASSLSGKLHVFTMEGGRPVLLGEPLRSLAVPQVIAGHLVTDDDDLAEGDPACCPSIHVRHTWTYAGGVWSSDPPR